MTNSISPTAVKTYLICPRRYRFTREASGDAGERPGWAELPLAQGRVVGETVQAFLQYPANRSLEALLENLDLVIMDERDQHPTVTDKQWLGVRERAGNTLTTFWQELGGRDWGGVWTPEPSYSVPVGAVTYTGRADASQDRDGVHHVLEIKSSTKVINPEWYTWSSIQTAFNILAIREGHPECDYTLLMLSQSEARMETVTPTPPLLDLWARQRGVIIEQMLSGPVVYHLQRDCVEDCTFYGPCLAERLRGG